MSDNIAIAQEIFHSMRRKKGPKGWMAVKIDLEKAYDLLKWVFVKDTLEDIGLPNNLVNLIHCCISSLRIRALWNREALEWFQPQRGIRKGDPISPYLFMLCIERLFHVISLAVENGAWKPVKVTKRGPDISHLAFADDLILFAEATTDQAQVISTI